MAHTVARILDNYRALAHTFVRSERALSSDFRSFSLSTRIPTRSISVKTSAKSTQYCISSTYKHAMRELAAAMNKSIYLSVKVVHGAYSLAVHDPV